jgi:translation initiation factor 4G
VQSAKVIHHNPSKSEKVELHKAEVPWMRPTERVKDMDEDAKETADVFRKFQGILNKLTPQKFKDLAEKARELSINTEERLKGCIDKIFTKALEEPNFSVAYAHLCRVLSYIKVEVVYKNESDEESVKEITFRRELLTRCQKEFEKDKKDDESRDEQLKAIENAITEEEKKLKEEQFSEWEDKARKRSLGNIRFIGELFKLKMLSESIMHECIVRLLRSTSDEDSLECFSRLITTTGKELDHQAAKQRMDRYFDRINEIIEKKKISSRIRFMLQDVQELRKNEWIPRRQDTLKTIDQIHQEAHMEEIQEKESIRQSIQSMSGKQFLREDKRRSKS